ncbi:hypothetical protein ACO0QE_003319 [Hanseniaspora vineae]
MTTENQLIAKFGPSLRDKNSIIKEFQSLMSIYGVSVHELYVKWEQYAFQNKSAKFEEAHVEKFKAFLQQQIERKMNSSFPNASGHLSANSSLNNGSNLGDTPKNFNKSNILSSLKRPIQQNLRKPIMSPAGNASMFSDSQYASKKRKTIMSTSSPSTGNSNKFDGVPKKEEVDESFDEIEDSFLSQYENNKGNNTNTSILLPAEESFNDTKDFTTPRAKESETKTLKFAIKSAKPKKSGQITKTLNGHISIDEPESEDKTIRVIPYFDSEKYKFRTMRQNVVDIADYLDDQIETFTEIIKTKYDSVEIGDPTLQSQSEIVCCGRIVPDSSNVSTKNNLNAQSIALETSRLVGIGKRVKLELQDLNNKSFFQGQIVGLKGKNPTGEYFHVNEVLDLPYLGSAVTSKDELKELYESTNTKSTKTLIAAGPFTSQASLDFADFSNFIVKVNTEYKPNCLVLLGPFIDSSNDLVISGNMPIIPGLTSQPKTLDELFVKTVSPILKSIDPSIQVILVPNVNDTASNHCAYPQAPFDRKHLQLTTPSKNIKTFPNPATFQLNEMFVGVSNIDFFKNCKDVFVGGDMLATNRFERLSRYVLQQRRYFPLFPSSWNETVKHRANEQKRGFFGTENFDDVENPTRNNDPPSVDIAYSGLSEFVSGIIPDLLILPSELNPFANIVDNVVVINPGNFFSRMTGQTGSFVQLTLNAPDFSTLSKDSSNPDEEAYFHDIWKRARVDVINV